MKTFLITLNWFANETVYLGLSYYGPSLGKNPPLSFFLSSLVELPSYVFCWYVMDRFGRRWPMCLLMILGGMSCVITVLLPENSETETLVLYLISKSMICGSFLIIYPFAGELYPTQARGVGIGFSSYVGGLGLIIIPFITYLGMIFSPL
jgi:nitrate/nitrite transporter NarK